MEEDIKFIKYYMKQYFYEDISIEDDFKFEEAIKNLLTKYKELKLYNDIYKEELKEIDKALNLEEGYAAPCRSEIIESLKKRIESLKKIIDNSIPKPKIKERMEVHKKYRKSYLKEYEKDLKENRDTGIYHDFAVKEQAKIDMCEELLGEDKEIWRKI